MVVHDAVGLLRRDIFRFLLVAMVTKMLTSSPISIISVVTSLSVVTLISVVTSSPVTTATSKNKKSFMLSLTTLLDN